MNDPLLVCNISNMEIFTVLRRLYFYCLTNVTVKFRKSLYFVFQRRGMYFWMYMIKRNMILCTLTGNVRDLLR